jgi:hypothetical protein
MGVSSIDFDVCLTAYPPGVFEHFEASFLADRVPLWNQDAGGIHLDRHVRVSDLAGRHRIEIRSTALDGGALHVACRTQGITFVW